MATSNSRRIDPYKNFKFRVKWDGRYVAGVSKVSVLKRTTDFNAVPVMGSINGVLFILYVLFWLDAWKRAKWSRGTGILYFVLSVLPTGGFFAERRLRRHGKAGIGQVAAGDDEENVSTRRARSVAPCPPRSA